MIINFKKKYSINFKNTKLTLKYLLQRKYGNTNFGETLFALYGTSLNVLNSRFKFSSNYKIAAIFPQR